MSLRVVQGGQDDDRLFGDHLFDRRSGRPLGRSDLDQSQSGLGRSVQPDAIRAIMRQARNNPAQEASARTRHLNIWVGADEALFSTRAWNACGDRGAPYQRLRRPRLPHRGRSRLAGRPRRRRRRVSRSTYRRGARRADFTVFSRCYLNEAAVMEARNPSYPGWAANNELIITQGNETDFHTIEDGHHRHVPPLPRSCRSPLILTTRATRAASSDVVRAVNDSASMR